MSRPAAAQRSAFQDELQEAVFARAARQQTADYSDDFDTDEDGMSSSKADDFKCTVEELPESISAVENSLKKSADFEVSFSDEETPQKVNPLKKETADGFFPTTDEEKPQQVIIVESQNLSDYKDENVYLQSQNVGDDDREDDKKFSVAEEITYDGKEGDHQNELPVAELQNKRESVIQKEEESKPVRKPREHRVKNASFSAENISIHLLEDHCKPSPQPRSVLRRSSSVKDKDIARAEDKTTSTVRLSSVSAPSSLTRLNDLITSERRVLSERPSPEGPWLTSSSPSLRINFPSADEKPRDSNLLMCGEGSLPKDHVETEDKCNDLALEGNGRKSPSVIELMMTTVYEKTKKLHKSNDDSPEENLQTLEEQMITDGIKDVSLNDKPECMVAKDSEEKQAVPQKVKPSSSGRSLTSTYLKKAGKAVPPSTTTSSQHLGTLKVLDNKHLQKYSAELDKADHLRAAVYQDWLEKKRVFLLELQRIKRNKTEDLRSKIEKKEAAKKEEAIASLEAWKAMKKKEAKKLAEKKKLEELKKRRAAEQNEEKKEEAQKAFEKWKEKKAEYLRERSRKEKQAEQIRKKKEEEVIAEKKRESVSAVEKWKEKKEEFIKQKNVEKIHEKKNEEIQQAEREEKDKRAIEEYERWLEQPLLKGQLSTAQIQERLAAAPAAKERKERRELIEKKQKKLQVILEDETPPPWSPPGKVTSTRSY